MREAPCGCRNERREWEFEVHGVADPGVSRKPASGAGVSAVLSCKNAASEEIANPRGDRATAGRLTHSNGLARMSGPRWHCESLRRKKLHVTLGLRRIRWLTSAILHSGRVGRPTR